MMFFLLLRSIFSSLYFIYGGLLLSKFVPIINIHGSPFPTLNITTPYGECLMSVSPRHSWTKVQKFLKSYEPIMDISPEQIERIKNFMNDEALKAEYDDTPYDWGDE